MNREKIQCYTKNSAEYPSRFLHIAKPPEKLYVLGSLPNPDQPAVAIVGARNATPYGRAIAQKFASTLSLYGVQIISGFARGIDRAGHEGALQAGCPTYAVFGNGVDVCYPRENWDIYQSIPKQGGFISEFPPGTEPKAWTFPMRNRLISALADKLLVVEAKEKSGALITADFALEQGKDVYAVPGRLDDAASMGCNRLIAQGAAIALSPEELLQDFGIKEQMNKASCKNNEISLAPLEETVYSYIHLQPKHIEELMEECKMSLPELADILLGLEMKNCIKEISRNSYIRV